MTISTLTKTPSKTLKKTPFLCFQTKPHFLFLEQKVPPAAAAVGFGDGFSAVDLTLLLPDSLLLRIFSLLPSSHHHPTALVCRRWLLLLGRLRHSLRLLLWPFLLSGRLSSRFPHLTHVDLLPANVHPHQSSGDSSRSSGIFLTHHPFISIPIDPDSCPAYSFGHRLLPSHSIDAGLRALARGCPNLRKLTLVAGTESGLAALAGACPAIQELELHRCTDDALRAIAGYRNLQVLRAIGSVADSHNSAISDVGLIILAHGCRRLVKLELSGFGGSYDGVGAIGECCPVLEELTVSDHRMGGGWIAAVPLCASLKSLRLQRCKRIDLEPGPVEDLGTCPALESVQLKQCQLRDKQGLKALFTVCATSREIAFQDCWGLDNDMFSTTSICRRVKFLSLEGCSLLTTEGLESVVLSWKELQGLRVVSCKTIRDSEVSPSLSSLFSILQGFKWQPDSRSVLVSSLAGTGMGTKGGRFFKRSGHLNMLLPNAEYPPLLH
eukprot:TRINITY_DN20739_c0_g1_i1.p1 TRINITY_DN20739_c0_g1~~TRINITY_DN20739_c0_g1_i1.p1  ORF type:complete len:533 (-),score=85.28 TRINITY_DN20739_c0_g1_i1:522-2003(-)